MNSPQRMYPEGSSSRVFVTQNPSPPPSPNLPLLCREALSLLFPDALSVNGAAEDLSTPYCYFLRQRESLLWIELVTIPFSRREISDYLDKARQIQSSFSSEICGILIAPDFEAGVRELLELIRIPIRLFRYREAISTVSESALWLEEVTLNEKTSGPPLEEPPSFCNRLSREELREFIQLEIDDASGKYNKS